MGNGRQVRERMIEAGQELLSNRGFSVTLLDVVERAKTPRGSIYYYFPEGKEQLFAEVIAKTETELVQLVEAKSRRHPTTEALLGSLVDHHQRRLVTSGFDEGCPLVALTTSADLDASGLRGAVESAFSAWTGAIEKALIERGLAQNESRQAASAFVAAVEGAIVMSRARRDPAPLEAVRALVPMLLGGLAPAPVV